MFRKSVTSMFRSRLFPDTLDVHRSWLIQRWTSQCREHSRIRRLSNDFRRLTISARRSRGFGNVSVAAGVLLLCGLGMSGSGMDSRAEGADKPSIRLRRANTNITNLDRVLMAYEYRLRENASLDKIFRYFASVSIGGKTFMTPLDLVRAITPGVPPSPNNTPINIPLFESAKTPEDLKFTEKELPEFFKFGEEDNGLISYDRFLVFLTLLSLPAVQIPVAYHMCAGEDFKSKKLRSKGLNVHNFDFIIKRNNKRGGENYNTEHEENDTEDITYYLFGPERKQWLSLEDFRCFHLALRDEVQKLQYYLLSDKLSPDNEPVMSLHAFARSVAALVPSVYRSEFLDRACDLRSKPLPAQLVDSLKKRILKRRSINPKTYQDADISTSDDQHPTASDITISFEEYVIWQEVLRSLGQMEMAVQTYSYKDGHFSPTNINRAAKAVVDCKLSPAQIWVIFLLFDPKETGKLFHDDFVRLLGPYSTRANPVEESEGLGLGILFGCLKDSCKNCARNWYQGTHS